MDDDGQFDYRTLTKEQIEYALQHIDGSRFGVDDLMIPLWGRSSNRAGVIHLHGSAAWIGAFAIIVLAAIPFFGGLSEADDFAIMPRFKYVFRFAILLVLVAIAVSCLSRSA
jgi:hypothetical protein